MASRKRKILSLEERIKVIERSEKGMETAKSIAESLGVGKTQIRSIFLDKEKIIETWKQGVCGSDRKYIKARNCAFKDVNELVWEWFTIARSKNIPITGRLIQEKALMFSEERNEDGFKASNGWLEAWRKRYSVKSCVLSGEAADVSDDIISDWSARLSSMCEGYSLNNIFNADETGMFFRSIPNRSMVEKGDACKGGKKSKDRLTFLFCASAVGEKLKPLVIGKSLNPRCFKGIHKDMLGVHYEANKKAWMTSKIFVDWVKRTNQKFRFENRNVLMFVDNCSSHHDVEASNLRLVFLPPNTTSKLQPMDAGIIQSVKINYRKRLLRHLISRMDACNTASELVKLVNILDAILWIKDVWSS